MAHVHQLLDACRVEGVNGILPLLNHVDVNAYDESGITALQISSARGSVEIVRELIAKGAALDQSNNLGWTPLLHACRRGRLQVVKLLIANKAGINCRTKYGASGLVLAARGGYVEIIQLLLDAGVESWPQTAVDSTVCEISALMVASQKGHNSVIRLLLDKGFDINGRSPSTGVSALTFAAISTNPSTCEILIQRGADPDQLDVNTRTPYCLSRHKAVKDYLRQRTIGASDVDDQTENSEQTIFLNALLDGDCEIVERLISSNPALVDISLPEHDGATPIILVSMKGQVDVARILIKAGCNLDASDMKNGWTALMQATYHNKIDIVELLLNCGADASICNNVGMNAFELSSMTLSNTDIYRMLANCNTSSIRERKKRNAFKTMWNRISTRFKNLNNTSSSTLQSSQLSLKNRISTTTTNNNNNNNNNNNKTNSTIATFDGIRTMSRKEFEKAIKEGERQSRLIEKTDRKYHQKIVSAKSMLDLSATTSPASLAMRAWTPAKNLTYRRNAQSTMNLASINNNNALKPTNLLHSPASSATAIAALSGTSSGSSTLTSLRGSRSTLIRCVNSEKQEDDDVGSILKQLSLYSYKTVFVQNEVDMEAFLSLTEKDLDELGIKEKTAKNRILNAISKISASSTC